MLFFSSACKDCFVRSSQLDYNIREVWNRTTPSDITEGFNWYLKANRIASRISGGNVSKGAGVIAALSPQTPWDRNIELATEAFKGNFGGTFSANVNKAKRILAGESPLHVLWHTGQRYHKTANFYECILNGGTSRSVVVDRHAGAVALGRELTPKEQTHWLQGIPYIDIEMAYRRVADELGIYPAQLQAIVWIVWRKEKGIKDKDNEQRNENTTESDIDISISASA